MKEATETATRTILVPAEPSLLNKRAGVWSVL